MRVDNHNSIFAVNSREPLKFESSHKNYVFPPAEGGRISRVFVTPLNIEIPTNCNYWYTKGSGFPPAEGRRENLSIRDCRDLKTQFLKIPRNYHLFL